MRLLERANARYGGQRREEDVAKPQLGDTETRDVDHAGIDAISQSRESLDRNVHHVPPVALHARNVLDANRLWLKDLGCTHHTQIQDVSVIIATRVVVQVRVALTWWAAHLKIDATGGFACIPLSRCERGADAPVE